MNMDGFLIGILLLIIGLILFLIGIKDFKETLKDVNGLSLRKRVVIYILELWDCLSLTSYLAWILCLGLIFLFSGTVFICFSLSIFK